MCDFSRKLIAWIDVELPADEAAEVKRHLEICVECKTSAISYERLSGAIVAYCDESLTVKTRVHSSHRTIVASAAGAIAAVIALLLLWPRTRMRSQQLSLPQPTLVAAPSVATAAPVHIRPVSKDYPRRAVRAVAGFTKRQDAFLPPSPAESVYSVPPNQPVVQIAIPAEEMFPPGAVPEGMHFAADMMIAPDGSAESLRLRPRLAGFERRTSPQ